MSESERVMQEFMHKLKNGEFKNDHHLIYQDEEGHPMTKEYVDEQIKSYDTFLKNSKFLFEDII